MPRASTCFLSSFILTANQSASPSARPPSRGQVQLLLITWKPWPNPLSLTQLLQKPILQHPLFPPSLPEARVISLGKLKHGRPWQSLEHLPITHRTKLRFFSGFYVHSAYCFFFFFLSNKNFVVVYLCGWRPGHVNAVACLEVTEGNLLGSWISSTMWGQGH